MNCSPFVIGVAGGTGSGKTTLATKLKKAFADDAIILSHDFYYCDNISISYEERTKLNYDHPNAFDTDLLIADIKKLKNGQAIDHPQYSFVTHTRVSDTVHVNPTQVIIVEGILIFENKDLLDLMDIKIFVDTERSFQFKMSPVKQRVTESSGNRSRPMHKFFLIGRFPCYKFFINTGSPHGPPFIMVAFKPYLCNAFKFFIHRNIRR